MNLALHRSITFWSGILVMIFICWAWWDSVKNWSQFYWNDRALSNIAGGIVVEQGTNPTVCFPWSGRTPLPKSLKVPAFDDPNFERGSARDLFTDISEFVDKDLDADFSAETLSASLGLPQGPLDQTFGTMHYRPPGDWRLFIPHWLILTAFTLPWSALLLWRARRIKRATPPA